MVFFYDGCAIGTTARHPALPLKEKMFSSISIINYLKLRNSNLVTNYGPVNQNYLAII
jgi:hypothetical protein